MHQNLIDRPDLQEGVRLHALSELGQDFLKAGLLDRAEEIFNKLVGTAFEDEAKRNLLKLSGREGMAESDRTGARTARRRLAAGDRGVLLRTGGRRDHALASR